MVVVYYKNSFSIVCHKKSDTQYQIPAYLCVILSARAHRPRLKAEGPPTCPHEKEHDAGRSTGEYAMQVQVSNPDESWHGPKSPGGSGRYQLAGNSCLCQ